MGQADNMSEAEKIRHAERAQYEASAPLIHKIGDILKSVRDVFVDIGLPIVDQIELKRMANGQIVVKGWGMGVYASHPQKKFIEAVMNGTVPGLEKESRKIAELFAQMDSIGEQLDAISEKVRELSGVTLEVSNGMLKEGFFMGAEHTDRIQKDARELAMKEPEAFKNFRASLGDELEKLHFSQVYSRFYFAAVTLPQIPQEYRAYFDMPEKPLLDYRPQDMSVALNRLPVSFFN